MRYKIKSRYQSAWSLLHPDIPVPLTTDKQPFDFLWHAIHPCDNIPWIKNIPRSDCLTGKIKIKIFNIKKSLIFYRTSTYQSYNMLPLGVHK